MPHFRRHLRKLAAPSRWWCAIVVGAACCLPGEVLQAQISPGDPALSQMQQSQMQPMSAGPMYGGQTPNGQMQFYSRQGTPGQTQSSARPAMWPGSAPEDFKPRPTPAAPTGTAPSTAGYRPSAPAGVAPGAGQAPGLAGRPRDNQQLFFDTIDLNGAKIAARVGQEIILWSEVSGMVDDAIKSALAQPGQKNAPASEVEAYREQLSKMRLNNLIEIKLALSDARRKIPEESLERVMESIEGDFDTKEIPRKLKDLKLNTTSEFDVALRAKGSSLERERRSYVETQVAYGWMQQATRTKREITPTDLLAYYQQHIKDYEYPARARFEQLLIRVPKPAARATAIRTLSEMGNEVWHGANFADVARARSQGSTASKGGVFDWTDHGSLASAKLDKVVFSLEIGRLSEIIEDERAVSIVRVLERKPAGRRTFLDVQGEIKEHLEKGVKNVDSEKMKEYLKKLREETPIWTIYDNVPIEEAETIAARKGSVAPSKDQPATRSAAAPTQQRGPARQ